MSRGVYILVALLGLLCLLIPMAFMRTGYFVGPSTIICWKNDTIARKNNMENISMPFGVTAWSYPLNTSFGLAEAGITENLIRHLLHIFQSLEANFYKMF